MIVGGMVLAGQVEQHLYRHTGRMHIIIEMKFSSKYSPSRSGPG